MAGPGPIPYEATFVAHFHLRLGIELERAATGAGTAVGLPVDEEEVIAGTGPESPVPLTASTIDMGGTRHDASMGDLITTVRDRGVLLEFKRDLDGWATEKDKKHKEAVLAKLGDGPLAGVSRAAHWFAYGTGPWRGTHVDLYFTPYLQLREGRATVQSAAIGLNGYLRSLVHRPTGSGTGSGTTAREGGEPWVDVGVPLFTLEEYLATVRALTGKDSGDGVAGLLLMFNSRGRLETIPFTSIFDLGQSLNSPLDAIRDPSPLSRRRLGARAERALDPSLSPPPDETGSPHPSRGEEDGSSRNASVSTGPGQKQPP